MLVAIKRKLTQLIYIFCLLSLPACSTLHPYHPLPKQLENQVQIPGMPPVRAWGDTYNEGLEASALQSLRQEKIANHGKLEPEVNILALSGGGGDGAFGAGLLCGWTDAGTRPQFKLVTGVSTGALMAPFAFLGPKYDQQLKNAYTLISDQNIYKPHGGFAFFLSITNIKPLPSLASNEPLANLINEQITEEVLHEIAQEHLKGRRLLVGTTQLNAQRLVIWNMGAIAASKSPNALQLFRQVLLASASLPVSFPPQYIQVEAAGQPYTEMHVDGGVEAQIILFENALLPFSASKKTFKLPPRKRNLYIIRNQKVHPEWEYVNPQLKYIAIRSIDTLTKSQSIGDLYRLYVYATRDDMKYHVAFIPSDFESHPLTEFDQKYMGELFARGYEMGKSGYPWRNYPPDFLPRRDDNPLFHNLAPVNATS